MWGLQSWILEVGQTIKFGYKSRTKATKKSFKGIYKHFKLSLVVAMSKGPDHLKLVPETQQAYSLLYLIFEKEVEPSANGERERGFCLQCCSII